MKREEAIEWLDDIKNITENWSQEVAIDMAIEALSEPKTGKWLAEIGYDGEVIYYECQHCGGAFTLIDGTPEENNYNYCPNCGAKMRGEEE